MTETMWSRLLKLNRLNVEQYKKYSSKFDWKIQRCVDFLADFTHAEYVLCVRHGTCQFVLRFCLSSVVMALTSCSL